MFKAKRETGKDGMPKTMGFLIKAMVGGQVTVEMHNNTVVNGELMHVDDQLNLIIGNARFKRRFNKAQQFSLLFINGTSLRYVHIPDEVNVSKLMDEHARKLKGFRTAGSQQRKKKWAKLEDRDDGSSSSSSSGRRRKPPVKMEPIKGGVLIPRGDKE
eukprot:TRINITY_DN4639_c0_g2_i1.p1 TRINITY_DN4639_c0_g2~~TRINITY_DN4639_c0_g2_i1.p1  ORF type:complete len:158 (+),score=47.00 TRINITY_DN4639_c0_g2_i1:155-628(+)